MFYTRREGERERENYYCPKSQNILEMKRLKNSLGNRLIRLGDLLDVMEGGQKRSLYYLCFQILNLLFFYFLLSLSVMLAFYFKLFFFIFLIIFLLDK